MIGQAPAVNPAAGRDEIKARLLSLAQRDTSQSAARAPTGLTIEQILADENMKTDLVSIAFRRFQAAVLYMQPYHDKWLRFFKLYHNIVDTVEDEDEPNTGVVYAYSIIEDLVSKITEPLLQMQPPCRVAAKRAGQEKQAERFSAMASQYFNSSGYQVDYTMSTREEIICGNAWEQDVWNSEYDDGRMWSKVMRSGIMQGAKSILGRLTGQPVPFQYESIEETSVRTPVKVGYGTRFPSIFRIYPEPHVHDVRKMHWLIEEEPAVAITDLKKRMIVDPATGQQRPFFNFQELEAAYIGRSGEIKPEPMSRQYATAEDELRLVLSDQPEKDRSLNYADDIDRVSLLWIWEPHRVMVIAQGRFLVAYQENVFQSPRIPYRLRKYTPQKDFLFGKGAVEPVENQLYELTDIHRLSMRNWVRIINRMVAYNEEAVPFEDDFTPSALGRVRIRPTPGRSVAEEIVPINHADVTPSMLGQESNTKGLIERALAVADFSPGTDGTKQTHKTLGGLLQIEQNLAQRVQTVRRMHLAYYQDQMWFMERLTSQFLMAKTPFTTYGPDGSTAIEEFDLWDIYTQGGGFDFVIEYDPAFGNDQVKRNQLMALFPLCLQYMQTKRQMGLQTMADIDLESIMRRIFKSFGWNDTGAIMPAPDGAIDPDEELKQMMAGQPVMPNPNENIVDHLAQHMAQEMMLAPLVKVGKIQPQVLMLLQAHIEGTRQLLMRIMQNPLPLAQAAAAKKMQQGGPQALVPGLGPGATPPQPPQVNPALAIGGGGTSAAGLGVGQT